MIPAPTAHPVEPALADRTSDAVKTQQLRDVTVWCTGGNPAHWVTSYRFSNIVPNLDGISVDMHKPMAHENTSAGTKNHFGTVKIEERPKDKLMSKRSPIYHTISFRVAVRVQDLFSIISLNNMHHYKFHAQGCGCMHWQLALLQAFARAGWIGSGDAEAVYNAISTLSASRASVRFPPMQGEFYQPQR